MVDDNVAFSIERTKHQTHPIVYEPVALSYASIIGEFGWNDAGSFIMHHFTLSVANVFEFVFVAVNRRKNECWPDIRHQIVKHSRQNVKVKY